MRDRLIEKICEGIAENCGGDCVEPSGSYCPKCHNLADYLLEDGWIRPPCKVGTDLYLSDYPNMHCRLKEYKFCGDRIAIVIDCWEWQRTCIRWLDDFGKTVFLTEEVALKGGTAK